MTTAHLIVVFVVYTSGYAVFRRLAQRELAKALTAIESAPLPNDTLDDRMRERLTRLVRDIKHAWAWPVLSVAFCLGW